MLSTEKLKNKEVINICDGKSLGYIYDIEVDLERGTIEGVIIPAPKGFFSFFGSFGKSGEDFVIKWDKIKTVGDDVVLVEVE